MVQPVYTLQNQVVMMETNVYSIEDERLIWTVLSETFVEGSADELIRSFIKLIVNDPAQKKVI